MNDLQQTSKSENPRLQMINEWIRDRLKKTTVAECTASFLNNFVEKGIKELTSQLVGCAPNNSIISVRSSFRKNNLFLRPVYSQPELLRQFLQDPNKQKPFKFIDKTSAFDGVQLHPNKEDANIPYAFAAVYNFDNSTPAAPTTFRGRINVFISHYVSVMS